MRIFERLMYLLGVGLAIAYGMEEFLACFILACLIIVDVYIGALVEGIRFIQFFYLVAFIPHLVLIVMDVYHLAALVIYCLFLGIAILVSFLWGEGNLNRFKITGPYEVGHKDIWTSEDGIECSCYYPMDREEYEDTIN